jgi:hypothetical protein
MWWRTASLCQDWYFIREKYSKLWDFSWYFIPKHENIYQIAWLFLMQYIYHKGKNVPELHRFFLIHHTRIARFFLILHTRIARFVWYFVPGLPDFSWYFIPGLPDFSWYFLPGLPDFSRYFILRLPDFLDTLNQNVKICILNGCCPRPDPGTYPVYDR